MAAGFHGGAPSVSSANRQHDRGVLRLALKFGVEHVSAYQKNRYGLFIKPIGMARANAKPTLAKLACRSRK